MESKPRDSRVRPQIPSRRPFSRTFSNIKNKNVRPDTLPEPSSEIKPALALLSHWIVDFMKSDPSLKLSLGCEDLVSQALTQLIAQKQNGLEDILKSTESLAKSLASTFNKEEEKEENRTNEPEKAKDSVHGNDVFRRSRVQSR